MDKELNIELIKKEEEENKKSIITKILKNNLLKYIFFYFLTSMSWLFSLFVKVNIADLISSKNRKEIKIKFFIPFFYKEKDNYNKEIEEIEKNIEKKRNRLNNIEKEENAKEIEKWLKNDLIGYEKKKKEIESNKFEEKYKKIFDFSNKKWEAAFWSGILMFLYSLIVFIHIFTERYLTNELMINLKKKIIDKYFRLKRNEKKDDENDEEKKTMILINDDVKKFSSYYYFGINQLYYLTLDALYVLMNGWIGGNNGKNEWIPAICFSLHVIVCISLCFFSYIWEQQSQKETEKEEGEAKRIISNNWLIIKKGEKEKFLNNYRKTLEKAKKIINIKKLFDTFQMVIPTYLLIRYMNYIFVIFGDSNEKKFVGLYFLFSQLLSDSGKMVERLKEYPSYFSSKKRISLFLSKEERNDSQKGIKINKEIKKISIKNLNFSYKTGGKIKKIFENFELDISKGKINLIEGSNGYGKSTLINIILGIFKPESGKIIINDGEEDHDLNEINLVEWRKIIGYCENNNLLENEKMSTGQKQFLDFENMIKKEKEIMIFDEADSALDRENREKFIKTIEKLSKKKMVILITHKN